jgi:hypothetical protein
MSGKVIGSLREGSWLFYCWDILDAPTFLLETLTSVQQLSVAQPTWGRASRGESNCSGIRKISLAAARAFLGFSDRSAHSGQLRHCPHLERGSILTALNAPLMVHGSPRCGQPNDLRICCGTRHVPFGQIEHASSQLEGHSACPGNSQVKTNRRKSEVLRGAVFCRTAPLKPHSSPMSSVYVT